MATYSLENMRDRRALFTLTDRLLRLKYLYTQLDFYRNSSGIGGSTGSNNPQIYTTNNTYNSTNNSSSSNTIKITITPSSDYSSYTSSNTSLINIQTTDPSSSHQPTTNQQYPSQSSTIQQHENAILSSPILKQAKINQIESEIILWYQQFLLYYNINNLTINDINLFITCINQSLLSNDLNGPIISTTQKTGTGAAAKPEKNTGVNSFFGSFFSSMMTQNSDPRNITEYIDYIKKRYNNNTSMFSIFDTSNNTNNNNATTSNSNSTNNTELNVDLQVYKLLYSIMMLDKNLYYLSNEMKILEKTV